MQIIFSDECIEAEGMSWHMEHFTCADCDTSLGGLRYVVRSGDGDRQAQGIGGVYCCDCYERCHADKCGTCFRSIRVDEGHMAFEGLHWHASDACFTCTHCRRYDPHF